MILSIILRRFLGFILGLGHSHIFSLSQISLLVTHLTRSLKLKFQITSQWTVHLAHNLPEFSLSFLYEVMLDVFPGDGDEFPVNVDSDDPFGPKVSSERQSHMTDVAADIQNLCIGEPFRLKDLRETIDGRN